MYFLKDFLDKDIISGLLKGKGLSVIAARKAAGLYFKIAESFIDAGKPLTIPVEALWIPGRIEMLGKHTDYAGGDSLLLASERGFCVLVTPDEGDTFRFIDAQCNETLTLDLEGKPVKEMPGWGRFLVTAVKRLGSNFGAFDRGGLTGFASNLPQAAGMSSSSALIIATSLSLQSISNYQNCDAFQTSISSTVAFADYLGHVENGQTYASLIGDKGVGTFGGSQDHTAILCASPSNLLHVRFKPTQLLDSVNLPDSLTLCVGNSGVKAEKSAGAQELYNRASRRAQEVVAYWNRAMNGRANALADIINSEKHDFQAFQNLLAAEDADLADRFFQFYNETKIYIPTFIDALIKQDYEALGNVSSASQKDAALYLKNQTPETNYLVKSACFHGAVAASAFGAGFGGAVWALVDKDHVFDFQEKWRSDYMKRFPQHVNAAFFMDNAGPAAFTL